MTTHKTPQQLAADKRHCRLMLTPRPAQQRNRQQLVIAPKRTSLLPHWNT